jgi:hypothetical protein
MTVVIHEFEVVSEPPVQKQTSAAAPGSPPRASALTPKDIERVVRHHTERCARVRAH